MPEDLYRSKMGTLDEYYEKEGDRKRKILVVDDDEISSDVLSHILEYRYETVTARNGKEALEILRSGNWRFSLILLDLLMQVMDGYEFLDNISEEPQFSSIPVIVITSQDQEDDEIRCFEKGAADFISKPYHPEIVKRRVSRIIRLRETAAVLNVVEHDRLTGLLSKESFYLEMERILEHDLEGRYDMVVADVENFKVINERYGVSAGDRVLCYMADRYRKLLGRNEICTRMHGDVFALFILHGDGSWKDRLLWQWDEAVDGIPLYSFVIKYGIYENVDRSIPPFGMYDRAMLALSRVKSLYGRNISTYNESLRADLLREQQILDSMESALAEHQFQVYYQPKYDIESECISGAEALIRWFHPKLGFMSPGEFIPLFERNGFITKLDYYVWEQACQDLCRWEQQGRQPIAVSVNVSRIDFALPDLTDRIIRLTDQYGISREQLHLEITESAYTDEPQQIIQKVDQLRESGFRIEMDDFGTGYSSLNMLSELSIDVLKLDMKFIQKYSRNKKSILGFIISLSKWLNLTTVAEGVENQEQVESLKRFGCDYVQGYYYAKPMPREEFERCLEENQARVYEQKKEEIQIVPVTGEPDGRDQILVVEDNEMNREILCRLISPYYIVREAANGQEALDYLAAHPGEISVILLDMMMPVMDGFQFMKIRNRDAVLSGIPVIITSESQEEGELRALRLGADYFTGKPYQKELLLLLIGNVLKYRK